MTSNRRSGRRSFQKPNQPIKTTTQKNESTPKPLKKNKIVKLIFLTYQALSKLYTRYKKWLPLFAIVLTIFLTWFANSPKKLKVTDKLIGKYNPISSAIIIENFNIYDVKNLEIKVTGNASFGWMTNTFSNTEFKTEFLVNKLSSQKSTHVRPSFLKVEGGENINIVKAEVLIVLSYETPFMYSNIKNDTTLYSVVLDANGNSVYLNK